MANVKEEFGLRPYLKIDGQTIGWCPKQIHDS